MSKIIQANEVSSNYTHDREFAFPPFYFEYFERTSTWDTKYDAYRRALPNPHTATLCLLAKTALELSLTAKDELAADDLQAQAVEHIKDLEKVNQPDIAVDTAVLKYNLPLQVSLYRHREHPGPSQIIEAYEGSLAALKKTAPTFYSSNTQEDDPFYSFLKGAATEAATLIMLQRYGAKVIQASDWTPIPALLSQERSPLRSKNWDISVITDADNPYSPANKIQVKWGNFDYHNYDDDISVVSIKKDLAVHTEATGTYFNLSRFINEVLYYKPGVSYETVYSKRIEQLLDKIDDAA